MAILLRLLLGFLASTLIGWLAYTRGSLSRGGILGAILVGTGVMAFGGVGPGCLLIAFFVSSSALSHYRRAEKAAVAEKFSKGERRDLGQALANGGVAALCAMALYAAPEAAPWLAGLAGALATANADTWGTEIGVLSRMPPRLITTLRPVEPGASGAITPLGTAAALAGALLIGLLAEVFHGVPGLLGRAAYNPGGLLFAATLGGLVGSLADSLLGATVQAIYYCDTCGKETERSLHTCGTRTRRLRGWTWLSNDWVNFIASAVGALAAGGLARLL